MVRPYESVIERGTLCSPACSAPVPPVAADAAVGREEFAPPPHAASIEATTAKADSLVAPCIVLIALHCCRAAKVQSATKIATRLLCKILFKLHILCVRRTTQS